MIVTSGSPAVFTVIATGALLYFEWYDIYGSSNDGKNSNTVTLSSGAVMNTFTVPSALVSDTGTYSVLVQDRVNYLGTLDEVTLTVGKCTCTVY